MSEYFTQEQLSIGMNRLREFLDEPADEGAVQENGGHMLVFIDDEGYIYQVDENDTPGPMVHRETRRMHQHPAACSRYNQGRDFLLTLQQRGNKDCYGLLELSPEGGGQAIYVPEAQADMWNDRLKFWKGCYGKWPIHIIKEA